MSAVVGRFAPTPSGPLHLGNLLCALVAYLSARSAGGRFLLRIEDLDAPRCPRALAQQAMEALAFLGITWDEPPLFQSERTAVYARAFEKLEAQGLIYPCFCSRAQLHATLAPNLGDQLPVYPGTCARLTPEQVAERMRTRRPAMRLRVPDETITLTDLHYGEQRVNLRADCGDCIVRRSDGLYAYHLAVVVDDAESGVTQIVRGRDILPVTPLQVYIYQKLGLDVPVYAHMPLLTDAQGRRLAKRDGDLGVAALTKRMSAAQLRGLLAYACGILPENRPADMDELIRRFSWDTMPRHDLRLPDGI